MQHADTVRACNTLTVLDPATHWHIDTTIACNIDYSNAVVVAIKEKLSWTNTSPQSNSSRKKIQTNDFICICMEIKVCLCVRVCLHMSTCACVRACMHACMCMYLHAFGNNFKYAIDYIQDLCNDFWTKKFPHCKILSIIKKKMDGKWEKLNYDRSSAIDYWNWMSIQLVRTADWPVTFPMAASGYLSWSTTVRLVKVSGRLVPRAVMVIPENDGFSSITQLME